MTTLMATLAALSTTSASTGNQCLLMKESLKKRQENRALGLFLLLSFMHIIIEPHLIMTMRNNFVTRVHPEAGLSLCVETRTTTGTTQRWFKANNPVPFDITWITAQPAVMSKGDVIQHKHYNK